MNKKIVLLMFMFTSIFILAENPLKDYITNEVFEDGKVKFPSKENIFKGQVIDMSIIKIARDEAINRINSVFTEVIFVIKKNNKWASTFYYIESKTHRGGGRQRKTVVNFEKMKISGHSYVVTAVENGIIVKDEKTGYKIEINKKGR